MHKHFTDTFNGAEAGVRFAERAVGSVMMHDGGGGAAKPPTRTRTVDVDGRPKTVPVTPQDVAKEAIKDGKISSKDKTAFDKNPGAREAVKDEQARLTEAVRKNTGNDHQRDQNGNLRLDKDGKPLTGFMDVTDHDRRVMDLARDKDKKGLDALDSQIARLEEAGTTAGVQALKQQRAARAAEEQQVVNAIEEKESLKGALELEKAELEADIPADAKNDYQDLRAEAADAIEQFNANGGQFSDDSFWFVGDEWDEQQVDFDTLAKRFNEDPKLLDKFAKVQGKNDRSGGDTAESMDAHIADVAGNDPELAAKIAMRYEAAQELQEIFGRYNTAKDAVDGNSERIAQINAEIGILDQSIEVDRTALSTPSLQQLDDNNRETAGILVDEAGSSSSPTANDEAADADEPTGTDQTTGSDEPAGTDEPTGTDETTNTDETAGQGGPEADEAPATTEVPIDYSTPERRQEVLAQAQAANLLPAHDTTFNEQGQAVYTVQPGDSYWHISDMSDGRPPHDPDLTYFYDNVQTNSARLGRDVASGLIHPNEQLILTNRSIDDLVAMLELPTVETVEAPVEEAAQYQRQGGNNVPV